MNARTQVFCIVSRRRAAISGACPIRVVSAGVVSRTYSRCRLKWAERWMVRCLPGRFVLAWLIFPILWRPIESTETTRGSGTPPLTRKQCTCGSFCSGARIFGASYRAGTRICCAPKFSKGRLTSPAGPGRKFLKAHGRVFSFPLSSPPTVVFAIGGIWLYRSHACCP